MRLQKQGGLHRALTWRYVFVTTTALLVVELLVLVVMTRLAPPYTFSMQPDVYMIRELAESAREYMLVDDYSGLASWLDTLNKPVVNVTFDDNWLRLNLDSFPKRSQQIVMIFRQGEGILAATPQTASYTDIAQIEELPGPISSDIFETVPPRPGDNIINVRDGSHVLSIYPIQQEDGTLLGLFIVLNFAETYPASTLDVLLFAGTSTLILAGVTAALGGGFGFLASRFVVRRLNTLVHTTASWEVGDFSHPIGDDQTNDEISALAQHLNYLRTRIQELMTMREQLAVLEERSRFARELHDSVKQQVFTLRMNMATIEVLMGQDCDNARQHLQKSISLAQNIQDELTLMIHMFRDQTSQAAPLEERLRTLLTEWTQHTDIHVDSKIEIEEEPGLRIAHAIYRVVQEALANVQKHSHATRVQVRVIVSKNTLTLHIEDNGSGFDTDSVQHTAGFGLLSMQERIEALGGAFTLHSSKDGTHIQAHIPIEKDS